MFDVSNQLINANGSHETHQFVIKRHDKNLIVRVVNFTFSFNDIFKVKI